MGWCAGGCADLLTASPRSLASRMHERSVGKLLHALDFSSISVRPLHPQSDLEAQEAFKKTSPSWHAPQSRRSLPAGRLKSGFRIESAGRPARHADPHLGQTRHASADPPRPAVYLDLPSRHLPGARHRPASCRQSSIEALGRNHQWRQRQCHRPAWILDGAGWAQLAAAHCARQLVPPANFRPTR